MRISIFGTGYVGSVTGICLAHWGHQVIFNDIDTRKLDMIEKGRPPVYEPGLDDLLRKNKGHIATTDNPVQAVQQSEISFICVGTPSNGDGSINLQYVEQVCSDIGQAVARKEGIHTVVVKSTVIPGTTEGVVIPALEKQSGKKAGKGFSVVSNPEFLREGNAVHDFFNPDRVIIGAQDETSGELVKQLYSPVDCPKMITSLKTSEMIKYVSNAFLATKISFANEIGNLCKVHGIDSYEVFQGVGMDARINPAFFRSGIGFGGSCFPKDVLALIEFAKTSGTERNILQAVITTNEDQPKKLVQLLKRHLDIPGKTIGILGLAFKPGTDDIRETRAIPVVRALLDEKAHIIAYDPLAMDNFRREFPGISYARTAEEVLAADAILIVTEWPEFDRIDYTGKTVIDGRRVERAKKTAGMYEGVCW